MKESIESYQNVQNIILIGFMAAGKSSVGRLLARELGWDYLDTDMEIEEATGLKISELFRKYGEIRFRSEESLVVKKINKKTKTVIATGGGTVISAENWDKLQEMGILIHLFVPLEVALSRINRRQDRPLLLKNGIEVEQLWSERLNIYNKAHITIDTSDKELATVVAEILTQVKGGYNNYVAEN